MDPKYSNVTRNVQLLDLNEKGTSKSNYNNKNNNNKMIEEKGNNKLNDSELYNVKHKAESKLTMIDSLEEKLDRETEKEWIQKLSEPNVGKFIVSNDPEAKKICDGFSINYMNMRCADSGTILWQSGKMGKEMYQKEQQAHIPKEILKCDSVSREINFTSKEKINNLRLEQRIFFDGKCMEEWFFVFGFVIPESTNTWQQTISSAGEDNMLDPEIMTGKLTIETSFHDGDMFISKTLFRIYYI